MWEDGDHVRVCGRIRAMRGCVKEWKACEAEWEDRGYARLCGRMKAM